MRWGFDDLTFLVWPPRQSMLNMLIQHDNTAFKHFGSNSVVPSSATCKHHNKLESRTDCFLNQVNYSFYAIWIFKLFCTIWNIFVSHKETCFSNGRMYIAVVFLILTSYCLLVIFDLYFVFPVTVSTVCFALPYSI